MKRLTTHFILLQNCRTRDTVRSKPYIYTRVNWFCYWIGSFSYAKIWTQSSS